MRQLSSQLELWPPVPHKIAVESLHRHGQYFAVSLAARARQQLAPVLGNPCSTRLHCCISMSNKVTVSSSSIVQYRFNTELPRYPDSQMCSEVRRLYPCSSSCRFKYSCVVNTCWWRGQALSKQLPALAPCYQMRRWMNLNFWQHES